MKSQGAGPVTDILMASAIAIVAAVVAWHVYGLFDASAIGAETWFQSDMIRVRHVLVDRYSRDHGTSSMHPLFALVNTTAFYGLMRLFGLTADMAIRLWVSGTAAALGVVCYAAARLVWAAWLDAALTALLLVSSSAFLFWASVPETRTTGAITMLVCVLAAAWAARRSLPDWLITVAAATSLSMTLSNFMAGLILLALLRKPSRAVQLAINAFFIVSVLQFVQHTIFPYAQGMTTMQSQTRFLLDPSAGTTLDKARVLLSHSVVMPEIQTPIEFDTHLPMVSVQRSHLFSTGALGAVATGLWVVVLGWGVATAARDFTTSVAVRLLLLTAMAQAAFHLVYGDQTFLYSLHYVPLFALLAGYTATSRQRTLSRLLLCATILTTAWNNVAQVRTTSRILTDLARTGPTQSLIPEGAPHAP